MTGGSLTAASDAARQQLGGDTLVDDDAPAWVTPTMDLPIEAQFEAAAPQPIHGD
jgi:hypothetical protein